MRPVVVRAVVAILVAAGCSHGGAVSASGSGRPSSTRVTSPRPSPTARPATPAPAATSATAATPTRTPAPRHSTPQGSGQSLPLSLSPGRARQVVTVVAHSERSTTAVLTEWERTRTGWRRASPALRAWLGRDGMTRFPSESRSATPEGSFSLTQAFGRAPNPGTALPYRRTTPADWWISQAGPLYNTLQHCVSDCPFTQGSPNEHLYEEMPFYEYAVVIDYNRSPVRPQAGSAFFVHVTVGAPTQGCVSIARGWMVQLLRWLKPSAQPRILLGTAK